MKRTLLSRFTAIVALSVSSLCLRSEKMACKVSDFKPVKSAQKIKIEEVKTGSDGLLPYYPLIIKI